MRSILAVAILSALSIPVSAQTQDLCRETQSWGRDDDVRHCEVREYSLANARSIVIDGGQNGGIRVEAWNQSGIRIRAVVTARAMSQERAQELASEVEVSANSPSMHAAGPRNLRRESWAVTWYVSAPAGTDIDLEVLNGGIRISGMTGTTRFRATNGGVRLIDMAGDVSGSTTNGGLEIELSGRSWTGAGMDVRATNGGVELTVPEGYSGEFETGTVNGRLNLDFPITVQGRFGGRDLQFTLGDGGARIRARTTNGGVRIRRG